MSATSNRAARLTVDQYVGLRPLVAPEPPTWSSDGSRVVFLSSLAGSQELWSVPTEGGFPTRLTYGMGGVRFLGTPMVKGSPDGKWIAFSSEKTGAAEIWLYPTDGGPARQLTHLGNNINSLNWSPDSQSIVLAANRYGVYDLYHVAVPSGETTRLTTDSRYEVYPTFTPDGENIVYVRLDDRWADHEVLIMPAGGGESRLVAQDTDFFDYHYGKTFGYPLVSPDNRTVLFRSHRSGWINYWQVPLTGGDPTPLIAEEADQSEAVWSPDGRHVAYIHNDNGTLSLKVVAADGSNPRAVVDPGVGACASPRWSPDGRQIAYLFQSPTRLLDLHVVDVASGQTRQLTHSMPGGQVGDWLIQPEKVWYDTFDGRKIPAYVYKPTNLPAGERVPGIVWVHGGPTSQYSDVFYGNAQFFAAQGYVVILPNIRGSSGYGKEFEDLNNADWGHDDLKDVRAAVDYLKTLPEVDPDNMGITGTSYGGCMSMSAVGFAPGLFQAAIPCSGYADWVHMHAEQELRHLKLLEYEFGPRDTHEHIYRKCSPIYAVKQATTPTFVLHGEGKPPRSEASREFVKALEKEYKTVEYKCYQGETYYVQSPANTRQMWLDMLDFFNRYLKDTSQARAAQSSAPEARGVSPDNQTVLQGAV